MRYWPLSDAALAPPTERVLHAHSRARRRDSGHEGAVMGARPGGGRPVFRVGQVLGEAVAAAEEDTAVVLTFWCARRRHAVRARARVRTHAIR